MHHALCINPRPVSPGAHAQITKRLCVDEIEISRIPRSGDFDATCSSLYRQRLATGCHDHAQQRRIYFAPGINITHEV